MKVLMMVMLCALATVAQADVRDYWGDDNFDASGNYRTSVSDQMNAERRETDRLRVAEDNASQQKMIEDLENVSRVSEERAYRRQQLANQREFLDNQATYLRRMGRYHY